ncbi:G-type lectin S-receptor-like serine/threonine-protein kinase B120 [Miscanthus floridulus]|uniref:G-type lectin S-receptor-like serine/threonine-protein kinase B120 n=1 Tax=Miscanthus floridulus TaxID=154761 RepID=UPI003459C10C
MARACIIIPILIILLSLLCQSDEDQLTQAKALSPGDVLISKDGAFALGFFFAGNSNKSLYIGIWYNKVPERTVVWVANRDNPVIASSSAKLAINNKPELVLSDSQGRTHWTTTTMNSTTAGGTGAFAALLSSGNFVLRTPTGETIWQSFDHPTDTLLPSMRLLLNHKAQVPTRLVSWKGPDDPSTGNFSYGVDPNSNLQFFTWHGNLPYSRSSVINSASMSTGMSLGNGSSVIYQAIVDTRNDLYYTYKIPEGAPYMRLWLDYTGKIRTQSWNSNTSSWMVVFERPHSSCDLYASCGPFGYCDSVGDVPTCRCPEGFDPIDGVNYSRGCQRKETPRCRKEDSFVTLPAMKAPDKFLYLSNRSFDQCAAECSRNCSCVAYAYTGLSLSDSNGDTSRCLVWTGDLIDMEKASFADNFYLRVAGSPVQKKSKLNKILLPIIAFVLLLTFTALVWTCKRRGRRQKKKVQNRVILEYLRSPDETGDKNIEFPFISFEDIVAATDHFSDSNMLGKGGFGKVYKGVLAGTKEVAVKRLSKSSVQGMEEFRNEVVLIAKLQHKNLVKLIGCCIHEDERLLVYEYLPNKSLDYFLFDSSKKSMLQWPTRFKIIQGVARGIMYLHQDSRLTIIHRDLKASNILLDKEMSPKISDFGMARIFFGEQLQANTNRVVGTYGYMAPEYAMEGSFSVKSDTYSFGVLLLEIVSGLKISSPHLLMDFPNLIVYAWNLWKDGKVDHLVDSFVVESSCLLDEVSRCVQIGLLCVQDDPSSRPFMAAVVSMLENRTTPLPTPKQPSYFAQRSYEPGKAGGHREVSMNEMSLTALEGR